MATPEQEQTERSQLAELLAKLERIDAQSLVRADELGMVLSFASGLRAFQRLLHLFGSLRRANLEEIPFSRLQQLNNAARQAVTYFEAIEKFSVDGQPSPGAQRDSLIAQVRDNYDQLFEVVSPVLSYTTQRGTNFEELESRAREIVKRLNDIVQEQQNQRDAMLAELRETLEQVRRAAQEAGVAQHAIYFRQEAEEHKRNSKNWLVMTGILSFVTIAGGFLMVMLSDRLFPVDTPAQSIQLAVGKLVVFSVLVSSVFASARIYRAHRHNFVVNQHRQNALSTFEAFVKASSDESTKNAVLLQATQCIFSPQVSGYVHQEGDGELPLGGLVAGLAASAGKK